MGVVLLSFTFNVISNLLQLPLEKQLVPASHWTANMAGAEARGETSGSGSRYVPKPAPPPPAAEAEAKAEATGAEATAAVTRQAGANSAATHQNAAESRAGPSTEAGGDLNGSESNQVPAMTLEERIVAAATRQPFCEICEIYFESTSVRRAHMRYHQLSMKAKFADGQTRTVTRPHEDEDFRCPIEGCTFSSIHTPMMNSHAHRCKPGEPRQKAEKCAPKKREYGVPSQHKTDFMKTRAKEQADTTAAKLKAEAAEKLEAKRIARAAKKSKASNDSDDSPASIAAAAAAAVAAATNIFEKSTSEDLHDDNNEADETAALLNLAEFDFQMAATNDRNVFAPSGDSGSHPCPKCGQVFASESKRRYHRRLFHQNVIKDLYFPERDSARLTNIERNEEDRGKQLTIPFLVGVSR